MANAPNALWVLAKGTLGRTVRLPNSIRFDYTGAIQTFTVPEDVTEVTIECHGAEGGRDNTQWTGGRGEKVTAAFGVSPGGLYDVYVGGHPNDHAPTGGWPGGGNGDTGAGGDSGGGGGGRSEVRPQGGGLATSLLIAGGGGGGGSGTGANDVSGGACGFYASQSGGNGDQGAGQGGTGATFETVGIGGFGYGGAATPGADGTNPGGGASGHNTGSFSFSGGGGGDGLYGGGGAGGMSGFGHYAGGGGGGASFISAGGADLEFTDAENSGHGYVIVSWDTPE